MWADHESTIDYINFRETAELVSDLVSNTALRPISIGIFGGWGSGKSTLVALTKAELEKNESYVVVDFDAWLYQDFDDARAALLESVVRTLVEITDQNESKLAKALSLLARVNKFRAMGLLAEGGALLLGAPAFGLLYKGIGATQDIVRGEGDEQDVAQVKAATKEALAIRDGLFSSDNKEKTPPHEIALFREDLAELLHDLDKTLVVFVDNLDRCLPKNAVLTLEAIRLILFMQNTAFVIAADEDMIRHAVSEHYQTKKNRLVNDYLDKLIQVPVHVPRLGVSEITSYSFLLMVSMLDLQEHAFQSIVQIMQDNLGELWKAPLTTSRNLIDKLKADHSISDQVEDEIDEAFRLASRLAPLLVNNKRVSGNPRIVKRLLNSVWMRASIASKRGMPTNIDKALLAKVAMFERCMSEQATTELYRQINEADEGKPDLIAKLETTEFDAIELPEAWTDVVFVKNWSRLEPMLENVDLRAVAYLARETLHTRLAVQGISTEAEEAVGVLLRTSKLSSPALQQAMSRILPEEMPTAMNALISELAKTTDWIEQPDGFVGAIALASKSEESASALTSFIKTIGKPPGWMSLWLKNQSWWDGGQ